MLDNNLCLSLSAERLGTPSKMAEGGYPPYNIELSLVEDGELRIRGAKRDKTPKNYLHCGIAAREFKRTFALADGVKVRKAELHEGLLAIELERPHQEKRAFKVEIASAG